MLSCRHGALLPCLLVFLFGPVNAAADTPAPLSRLASHSSWLKLGHYESDSSSSSGWRSAIHSPEFFLDPKGRDEPLRELEATLAAFASGLSGEPDKHPQCRFPARWLWLKATISKHPAFNAPVDCPAYRAWTRSGAVSSVSIVFATGYLGNPASYYGHTLLKFNFRADQGLTRLLDVSVNYGAIVEKDVGPVTYIAKSLTGGYDGGFSHIQFYFHNHNYGDVELRDLWEYKLDLPDHAVGLIVAHAWEVLGKRYTYHFFRKNCAYRMAELIEIAEGVAVIPDDSPWVIPQALIQKMARARYQGKPLLADVSYMPSRQSRFYSKYRSLSGEQVRLLADVVQGLRSLQDPEYSAMPTPSKQLLIDTLIDYYQFVASPLERAPAQFRQAHAAALSARYQLPPGLPAVTMPEPGSPHGGRPPAWLQSGWGHQSNKGSTLSIRYRPAYYDAMDSGSGHVENSALSMGDTVLNIDRNRVYLKKFDLFAVDSVNPGLTGLPGDSAGAMKARVGVEQLRLSCRDCLAPRLQGDIGYGRRWYDGIYSAAYVGGAVQADREDQGLGFTRASADLILKGSEGLRAKLSYEHRFPIGGGAGDYGLARLEARWRVGRSSDIRLLYERDRAHWISIGHGIYW